jgi:tetratricopeptide (TPR) repeat protein
MHYQKPTEKRQTYFLKPTLTSRQWLVYSCHAVITIFSSIFIVAVGQDPVLSLPKRTGETAPIMTAQTDKRAEAERLYDEGVELFRQGTAESLQQAIEKLETALPLWRELGDESKEARINLILGKTHDLLGLKQKALDYYNQALLLYQQLEDRAGEALTLYNIGQVYYDLEEKQRALEYYQQSLPLAQTVGHRTLEVRTLGAIGVVYSALGDKQRALEYYQQALPLTQAVEDRTSEAIILINIGAVYSALGDKQRALEYYQQALPLAQAVEDHTLEVTILNNINVVNNEVRIETAPTTIPQTDKRDEAERLSNQGWQLFEQGTAESLQQAIEKWETALPLWRELGDESKEAWIYLLLGRNYGLLGLKHKALDYYNQALVLYQKFEDSANEALSIILVVSILTWEKNNRHWNTCNRLYPYPRLWLIGLEKQ